MKLAVSFVNNLHTIWTSLEEAKNHYSGEKRTRKPSAQNNHVQSDSWEESSRMYQSWFQQHSNWDNSRSVHLQGDWCYGCGQGVRGTLPYAREESWKAESLRGAVTFRNLTGREPSVIPNFASSIPSISAKGPCWQNQSEARGQGSTWK